MELCDKSQVRELMKNYGFSAPDMTITEFVEDELTDISAVPVVRCRECRHFNLETHECENELLSEVVEDEQFREATKKEETNMDKPRICEVLGVDVGERFELDNTGIILMVNDDGLIHIGLSHGNHKETDMNVNYLVKAINHPERIIRKPRFTEREVERAKAIKVLWPNVTNIALDGIVPAPSPGEFFYYASSDMFPSLNPGETISINDIIGGAE